jgi:radical SAM superfamily enzyme YgiQ (UPF0313 family)
VKIVLVIPPSPFLIDDRVFPFLGPLQIAAVAREHGHDVAVADLTGYRRRHPGVRHPTRESVLQEAEADLLPLVQDADVVGFYSLAAQHPFVVRLLAAARRAGDAQCILGGPHANTAPDRCLSDGFDQVIVADQGGGGGEPGFLHALDHPEARIVRVSSREGGTWANDRWPFPARDLLDLDSYRYEIDGARATSMVTASGCPFGCHFCSHWDGYRKMAGKSAARVGEEIDLIIRNYGYRGLMMYDDEINLRPDFETDFLAMLKSRDIRWRAFFKNGRNLTRAGIFARMADSGCAQLCTGAESADSAVLAKVGKGATVEDNAAFVRHCVRYGIKPKVFTQVGLPGETPETIVTLRNWLVAMASEGLADADVSITTPYEGSPMYDHPERFDIIFDKNELDYSRESILWKGVPGEYRSYVSHARLTREDIVRAREWIEDEFRAAAGLAPLVGKDDG